MSVTYQEICLIHLFELAAGLKSMVLGENEILSQIKSSYSFAWSLDQHRVLNKVFQMVIATEKTFEAKQICQKEHLD